MAKPHNPAYIFVATPCRGFSSLGGLQANPKASGLEHQVHPIGKKKPSARTVQHCRTRWEEVVFEHRWHPLSLCPGDNERHNGRPHPRFWNPWTSGRFRRAQKTPATHLTHQCGCAQSSQARPASKRKRRRRRQGRRQPKT